MGKAAEGILDRENYGDASKIPLRTLLSYTDQLHEAKRAEENNTSIDYLKDTAMAAGAHRLGDSALTYGVRRGGLFQNYYANVAKEGVNAALSGKDVMPQWRRALGIISPSLTGLTDYEVSRGLTHKLLHDLKSRGMVENPKDLKSLLKQYPQGLPQLEALKKSVKLSPIARNIVNATNPALPKNKLVEFFKNYGGVGVDRQKNPAFVGGALAALTGATHGLTGAAGGLISASPDLMFGAMGQNKDLIKSLEEMKVGIIGAGTLGRADTPLKSKFISGGLNAISPSSGEIYDLGQDLAQPLDKLQTSHKTLAKKFIGEKIISPGRAAPLNALKYIGKMFKLGSTFAPDYTPEDLRRMGVYEEVYDRTKPRLASLNSWPQHWFHPEDKMGWLEWYEKYNAGRRMEDDERQIKRWKAFKARHGGQAFQGNPTPRRAYALRNWGIDPIKLLNQGENQVKLKESMRAYKDKKYEKVAGDWLGYLHKLEKTATTIGATKNLLRQLKGDGINIVRRSRDTGLAHPTQRLGLDLLEFMGPAYLPEQKTIYLPRFKKPGPVRGRAKAEFDADRHALSNNSALNEYGSRAQHKSIFAGDEADLPGAMAHFKPRELLFHEGGHALHHLDDSAAFSRKQTPSQEAATKQLEQLMSRKHSGKEYMSLFNKTKPTSRQVQQIKQRTVGAERIANNNAVNFMQEQNVPRSAIEAYIRNMEKGYGTYLRSLGTPEGKPWDYIKYFSPVSVNH